jgi:hypothetical protein
MNGEEVLITVHAGKQQRSYVFHCFFFATPFYCFGCVQQEWYIILYLPDGQVYSKQTAAQTTMWKHSAIQKLLNGYQLSARAKRTL